MNLFEKKYKGKLDKVADEYIYFAADSAQRMSLMVKGLLEYSRAGSSVHDKEEVDFTDLVEAACMNLKFAIDEVDAEIQIGKLPVLYCVQHRFEQLFQNLIGNAIKYKAKEKPVININAVLNEGNWLFSIQDNGIGINVDQKDRVFQLYKRLNPAHEHAGSGIGLAICKKIVESYGGKIWVESEVEQGATFNFTIPENQSQETDIDLADITA